MRCRRSILAWYIALQFFILPLNVEVDPEARELLFRYLPSRFFQYSEVRDNQYSILLSVISDHSSIITGCILHGRCSQPSLFCV